MKKMQLFYALFVLVGHCEVMFAGAVAAQRQSLSCIVLFLRTLHSVLLSLHNPGKAPLLSRTWPSDG
jgi:hypothetical protein